MKTAKRVLAILMAMLMAVSAFAVAASAEDSIAAQLASGNYASISKNTKESVVIDKDATIDLGGKILKSANGSPAITVTNGATVTIQNGYVESYAKSYSGVSETLVKEVIAKAPAAIQASGVGTKVILKDVRAMGGLVRIPSTTEWTVPAGSAVKIYNGAEVELDGAVLIGSYGVSNDPAGLGRADGLVTIKEAIVIGYLDYVKRVYNGVSYDEATVEKVNAKDRIAGFLNSNVKLESYEQDLLDKALDDRIYIFTKKPVDENAIVTFNKNNGKATITASTVNYLEREIGVPKSTDCSYRYVPINAYDVESGKTYKLDKEIPIEELEGKEIRINYRLQFELKGDVKKLANNFDYYYNKLYNLAVAKADAVYNQVIAKYDSVVAQIVDLYKQINEAGQRTATIDDEPIIIDGQPANLSNLLGDNFYFVLRSLLSVGGVTMYEGATGKNFTTRRFEIDPLYNYGEAAPDPSTYVLGAEHPAYDEYDNYTPYYDVDVLGPLDKVEALANELKEIKGDSSLGDQSKWVAYAHFILDNYEKVLGNGTANNTGLIGEVYDKIVALRDQLTDPETDIGAAIEQLGVSGKLGELDKIINALKEIKSAINTVYKNEIVTQVKAKVDAHANDGTVETYMGKLISAVNNYRQYFKPENFVTEDGNFGITYAVSGPTQSVTIEKGKLHVAAYGGVVYFNSDAAGAVPAENEQWMTVPYAKSVTLNAVADEGNEFMYYKDAYSNRILSTNPKFVIDTQVERYVVAVFEAVTNATVVFTNHSGVICDSSVPYSADGVDSSDVQFPTYKGYDAIGWGPNGKTTLTSADFKSAYKSGNSAFENGANYNINGYAFKLNKTTSNKYLVTPKYTAVQTFTVTFMDGGTEWSKDIKIGDAVSYTAAGENFSYWMNNREQIVSVSRTYNALPVEETTYYAVYGEDVNPAGYINITSVIEEDSLYRIYSEKAVPANRKVVSYGTIYSFTNAIQEPEVKDINNTTVKAVYSTDSSNSGSFTSSLKKSTINSYPNGIFVRSYVEVKTATGTEFIYSDVYSTVD